MCFLYDIIVLYYIMCTHACSVLFSGFECAVPHFLKGVSQLFISTSSKN